VKQVHLDHEPSFLERRGVTSTVALRLAVVVAMVIVIGVRFERTIVAVAISIAFLVVFVVLGRSED
jgi:hypothetical protein